jgi:hypothetical protein
MPCDRRGDHLVASLATLCDHRNLFIVDGINQAKRLITLLTTSSKPEDDVAAFMVTIANTNTGAVITTTGVFIGGPREYATAVETAAHSIAIGPFCPRMLRLRSKSMSRACRVSCGR